MSVFLADEQDEPVPADALRALAQDVLAAESLAAGTEVSIVLVEAAQIAEYNARFLDRSGPTDVLAFPLEDMTPGLAPTDHRAGPPLNLGDVFICPAVVSEHAGHEGVAFEDEMALMVVHGILHLLGYDHDADSDAELMESRERELLAGFQARR